MIARAIHHNSLRADKPFVAVDCNTLNEQLFESELFGHVKGAFTGAVVAKRGLFEMAAHGTLFFDEFGNIPHATQAKLLRVIQEREYRAVGGTATQSADVRLVAATNKDLKAMVAEGSFREDLFYRINVFPIHAPALRERRADIPPLAFRFLKAFCEELGRPMCEISEGALSLLVNHDWPGNVRELENAMHRVAILAADSAVRVAHLASVLEGGSADGIDVPRSGEELKRIKKAAREKSVEEIERKFVQEALRRNNANVTRSAEATGMLRANFQALMKKHGIRASDGEFGGEALE
jgi:transcriptional regulator with GAF, ATPase, and Fis domain